MDSMKSDGSGGGIAKQKLSPEEGGQRWDAQWDKDERAEALAYANERLYQAERALGEIKTMMDTRIRELQSAAQWVCIAHRFCARADAEEVTDA